LRTAQHARLTTSKIVRWTDGQSTSAPCHVMTAVDFQSVADRIQ